MPSRSLLKVWDARSPRGFSFSSTSLNPALSILPSGGAESFGTHVVHVNEAECLGKWYPISSAVHEFDLRSYFPKHSAQIHLRQRSLRNRTFGRDGRTSGKGETPN